MTGKQFTHGLFKAATNAKRVKCVGHEIDKERGREESRPHVDILVQSLQGEALLSGFGFVVVGLFGLVERRREILLA